MGASYFPKELMAMPAAYVSSDQLRDYELTREPRWLRKMNNVVFESHHQTGGHFAATEQPDEVVQDVRNMFAKGSPAFAIVPGKTGYA